MGNRSVIDELREFLRPFVREHPLKKDSVYEEDVEMLIHSACIQGIGQDIIDYGTAHPEAPFWDFLKLEKPGLYGVTQEELLLEDGEE